MGFSVQEGIWYQIATQKKPILKIWPLFQIFWQPNSPTISTLTYLLVIDNSYFVSCVYTVSDTISMCVFFSHEVWKDFWNSKRQMVVVYIIFGEEGIESFSWVWTLWVEFCCIITCKLGFSWTYLVHNATIPNILVFFIIAKNTTLTIILIVTFDW